MYSLLWPLLLTLSLLAEDASHLLVAPPPVDAVAGSEEQSVHAGVPASDTLRQQEEEQKKRQALEQPIEVETESEGDIEKVIKNPKFKVNIPF